MSTTQDANCGGKIANFAAVASRPTVFDVGCSMGALIARLRESDPETGDAIIECLDRRRAQGEAIPARSMADAAVKALLIQPLIDDLDEAASAGDREAADAAIQSIRGIVAGLVTLLSLCGGIDPNSIGADYFLGLGT